MAPSVDLVEVSRRRYAEVDVDCNGAISSADIEGALGGGIERASADGERSGLCLRAVLRVRVEPGCRVDIGDLQAATGGELAMLDIRDQTQPAFNLDELRQIPGSWRATAIVFAIAVR